MFGNCTICQSQGFQDFAFLFAIAAIIWAWNNVIED